MKNHIATAKKFVADHKVAIAVAVTTTVVGSLVVRNQKVYNDFLKEHDLFDTFYALEED